MLLNFLRHGWLRQVQTPEPEQQIPLVAGAEFDPALQPNPQTVLLVKALAKELAVGQKPEFLFVCEISKGVLAFEGGGNGKPTVLLFMTPFAALDYLSATGTAAQVHPIKFEAVPDLAQQCVAAGAGGFALNRCPRCPLILSADLATMANKEKFALFWGLRRAAQICFGQRSAQEFLAAKDPATRRAALELIRDHIDCSVPYVYELLAMVARADDDVPAKSAAVKELEKFGPQFANWELRWDTSSPEVWTQAMAEAFAGLCLSFGMEPRRAQRA
jgi:hypothetical protein